MTARDAWASLFRFGGEVTRIPLSDEADPFDDDGSDLAPDALDILDMETPDALDFNAPAGPRVRNVGTGSV